MGGTWFIVILLATLTALPTEGARILAIEPFPSRSHMVVLSALTKELARRGHEVVVVSSFPLSKPMANYTDIDTSKAQEEMYNFMQTHGLYKMSESSYLEVPRALWQLGQQATSSTFSVPQVRDLLKDTRGFDLVIAAIFMNEAVYGFANHFKSPLVLVSPFGGFHMLNHGHGNPSPPSYVPNPMLTFTDHMSLWQRFCNTAFNIYWDLGHHFYYLPRQEALRKEFFGEGPSVWELASFVSVTLVNNHFSLNYPRPLLPSIVEVGGMHVDTNPPKLPQDTQEFLDQAKEGAIYFSMGSNLRSDKLPEEKLQALLSTFAQFSKYRVLFKWENDYLPRQPPNMKVGKWLPQQSVLAHPNVRVFITHGGLLSTQEAMYHGVPLVGIPVFGDQAMNMKKAELSGFGVMVPVQNLTRETVESALDRVLHDPKYRKEAQRRSRIIKDQPETPLDRAVFWTEYVMRHKGAPHLRSAALDLSWYQLHLLDVTALVVLALATLVIVICASCKALKRLCCGGKGNKKSKKE